MEKFTAFTEAVPRMGIAMQTGRNWLSQGRFPIPTYKIGRLRFVKESDLQTYFDNLAPDTHGPDTQAEQIADANLAPRKRGRPRKQWVE